MGATEAITAAILGLCEPGDEVLAFDPDLRLLRRGGEDDRRAARAGPAAPAGVDVRPRRAARRDHAQDARDPRQLAAQPDRPGAHAARSCSGSPTSCIEHDLIAITDEVYEHLVFDGLEHIPLATLPGHGRAHADDLLARQDVQRHRLEGRLGDRARRRWSPASARPSSS